MNSITKLDKIIACKSKDGIFDIERNGQKLICPFRNPLIVPGKIAGSIDFVNLPCSSICPHFNINEYVLNLTCGQITDTEIEIKEQSESLIQKI